MRRYLAVVAAAAAIWSATPAAQGYEFEVRARTIGQVSALRLIRLDGPDEFANRRRFTQLLALDVWDVLGNTVGSQPWERRRTGGAEAFVTSMMRIDHDYGDANTGRVVVNNRRVDVVDLVPEFESQTLALDVLYLHAGVRGLADGRLDVSLGRHLRFDAMRGLAFDGIEATIDVGKGLKVSPFGGVRVRDDSVLGTASVELDGTASAECREYVEDAMAGSGSWRPIDVTSIAIPSESRYRNELDRCPQREVLMPTAGIDFVYTRGAALAVTGSYRRSMSASVGLLGTSDRFSSPDLGYYPNERGQDPGWATNEELLGLAAAGQYRLGTWQLAPAASVEFSALHALLSQARASWSIGKGRHRAVPELYWHRPLFDGDSIFNVFGAQPFRDARLSYGYSRWGATITTMGWWRRYDAGIGDQGAVAGGGQVGVARRGGNHDLAVQLYAEAGYGGDRLGGFVSGGWHPRSRLALSGRVAVYRYESDSGPVNGTFGSAYLRATYQLDDEVAVHMLIEDSVSRYSPSQVYGLAVLDLAFHPDT